MLHPSLLYNSVGLLVQAAPAGIPGDDFFRDKLVDTTFNQIRMAKEFVKFNERCFVRLLGDMRSYNYVMDITPDFDDVLASGETHTTKPHSAWSRTTLSSAAT